MQKIIFLQGLPASGKTTWAKQYCIEHSDFIRINKDDIRILIGSPSFNREIESKVLEIERLLGNTILLSGKSLIVDDTNFSPKHWNYWKKIAHDRQYELLCKTFDTPIEECIKRDLSRENPVGESVIKFMHDNYLKRKNYLK